MKKIFISLSFLLFAFSSQAQINVGGGISTKLSEPDFGLMVKAALNVSEKVRVAGGFSYFFIHASEFNWASKLDWSIDGDAQYELITIADNINIFPFAGINLSKYSVDNSSNTDIGLNAGLFVDFHVNDEKLNFFIEPKFLVSDASSFIVSAGLLF